MKQQLMAIVLATIAAGSCSGGEPVERNSGTRIRFSFSGKEIIVTMIDNSAARSLVEMLPLTLQFEDYAGSEKISSPPKKLDTSDAPVGYDPSVGDLTLYAPWGNLAFFYRDHGYAHGLVPLGTIESGAAFLEEVDRAAAVVVEVAEDPQE